MNEQTKKLLVECNYGCHMAVESMEQILEYVEDDELKEVIHMNMKKHEKLEQESSHMLEEAGKEEKEPGVVANAFIWLTTEMKLRMQDGNHQITKILMNGCNMGIQSISKCMNTCCQADGDAVKLAKKLVELEEDYMKTLKKFI